jgi:hypothetical protein
MERGNRRYDARSESARSPEDPHPGGVIPAGFRFEPSRNTPSVTTARRIRDLLSRGKDLEPAPAARHDWSPTNRTWAEARGVAQLHDDRAANDGLMLNGVVDNGANRERRAVEMTDESRGDRRTDGDRIRAQHIAAGDVEVAVGSDEHATGYVAIGARDVEMHRGVAHDQTGAVATPSPQRERSVGHGECRAC